MTSDKDAWSDWNEPRLTRGGPETPLDHWLVEIRTDGTSTSRTVDPKMMGYSVESHKVLWRPMIWARDGVKQRQFYNDVSPEAVLEGLDDFLFLRIHSAFEQVFEGRGLNEHGARRWLAALEQRRAWCADRGAEYRFLVVPDALAVYSDKVPGQPTPSEDRPIKQILRYADASLRRSIVYPQQELIDGRASHATFYRDDVHFTAYGAFLCYRVLMESLPVVPREQIIRNDQLKRVERQMLGGYGRLLDREPYPGENFHPPKVNHQALVKDTRMKPGKIDVWETEHRHLPSAVIFRTSNTSFLVPFLLHNFSRVVTVAGETVLKDLIESERPAVVVTETAERYIAKGAAKPTHNPDWGLEDRDVPSFQDYTTFPLPLPRGNDAPRLA